jgi:hypothetical protein
MVNNVQGNWRALVGTHPCRVHRSYLKTRWVELANICLELVCIVVGLVSHIYVPRERKCEFTVCPLPRWHVVVVEPAIDGFEWV